VSVVVGIKGMTCADKVSAAAAVAKARTAFTGRKTVVCPAITHSWAKRYKGVPANPSAKCGGCTMCADALVDIVYPLH
jgi:formate hydrogenlyase subunit 6/NADH:ubiquinone oxidoreductase subunit I